MIVDLGESLIEQALTAASSAGLRLFNRSRAFCWLESSRALRASRMALA